MNIDKFEKIICEIKKSFEDNKNIIKSAIKKELENGYMFYYDDCIKEVERAKSDILNGKIQEKTNQEIAVIYDGKLDVTINIIINSIYFNNKIDFYSDGANIIRTVIIEIINNTLKNEFNIEKCFELITENYNQEIIENQSKYDKIIFIGDYFELNNIQNNINKEIVYNSYGFVKVYINSLKYKNEHTELVKMSYKKNIGIEYYYDINEFIENVREDDTVIIFENIDEISKKIKVRKIFTYNEFIDDYKFEYIN